MGTKASTNSSQHDWLGYWHLCLFLLKSLLYYPITGLREFSQEDRQKEDLKPIIYVASLMIWLFFLGWGLRYLPTMLGWPFRPLDFIYSPIPSYFFISCGIFYVTGLFIFLWSTYRALRG